MEKEKIKSKNILVLITHATFRGTITGYDDTQVHVKCIDHEITRPGRGEGEGFRIKY